MYRVFNNLRRIYWYIFRPKTRGVKCLIEYNNTYLLIKTTYSGDYWTIPGGGCTRDEDPQDTVLREIAEEVGIHLDKNSLADLGCYETTLEYKHDTVFLFHAQVQSTQLRLHGAEIFQAQWFDKTSLPLEQSRALKQVLTRI